MLTLIEGGFSSQTRESLMSLIKGAVIGGRRAVLLVPEQDTLSREREASLMLPPEAPLSFEVSNFTRFTNTVFRRIGGISGDYCTPTDRSLIMWRALTELSGTLRLTADRRDVPQGTVARALSAVAEMESLGKRPEELLAAAELISESDARLEGKLSDLGRIWSLYKRLLSERYSDAAEDLSRLTEMLREGAADIGIDEIYIDGFTSFTEPQHSLLDELMSRLPVTVVLTLPPLRESAFEYGEVRECKRRLLASASRRCVERRIMKPTAKDPERSEAITRLGDLLWQADGTPPEIDDLRGRVRILEAATPFEECDFIAADIRRLVMSGYAFSDITVVARRATDYAGLLDTALKRAGVPHFMSIPRDVSATAGVKLIYTAYAISAHGFRREDVLTYLKTGLTGIDRRSRDRLESYISKWRLEGERFTDGITWNMNPRGYEPLNDYDREELLLINEAREALVTPLIGFVEDTRTARTVREHAEILVRLLTDLRLEERLLSRARSLEAAGEPALAEENARLWGIICTALDKLVDLLGDVPANAESFANQLSVVFSHESMGLIPAHVDEVTVGSADMLRLNKKRQIYLLGVNRNEFPAAITDGSYFTDRDKVRLQSAGLDLSPDTDVRCARELYCFSRAFCAATECVTLLFADKSAAASSLHPSEVIDRIVGLSDGRVRVERISELPIEERLYVPELAPATVGSADSTERAAIESALLSSGREDLVRATHARLDNRALSLSAEVLSELYSQDSIYLSQSRLDSFLGCPMSYFCRYVLRLNDDREAELGANVVGSFIHGILEGFFDSVVGSGRDLTAMTREEKERLIESCTESYVATAMEGANKNVRARVAIKRLAEVALPVVDGICEELSGSTFAPVFFELGTHDEDPLSPRPVVYLTEDGKHVVIGGKVDRVDAFPHDGNVYVRVIDYKTGKKEFSPSDLEEGYNIQMFLYLKAIVETETPAFRERLGASPEGSLIPAGVMYVKTRLGDTVVDTYDGDSAERAVRAQQGRDGMVLSDPVSLEAMHPDFLPPKPSPRARQQVSREYDLEGWKRLNDTVEHAVLDLVGRMRSGDVSASPRNDKYRNCVSCPYKHICRSAVI